MEDLEYARMAAAEDRHWWYAGLHDLALRLARREATRLGRPLAMLDAGCGTGRLAQLLSPLGEVTGCDVHPLALQMAARRGITRLLEGDLAEAALGIEQFDLITCIDVLYHRRVRDEAAALCQLQRALRPGGRLLLQVPAFPALHGSHDIAVHTRRRYRPAEVDALLREAGFRIDWITCRLWLFFLPMLFWRQSSRRRAADAADETAASDVATLPHPWLNALLRTCVKTENRLVVAGLRCPFGTSVFASAQK